MKYFDVIGETAATSGASGFAVASPYMSMLAIADFGSGPTLGAHSIVSARKRQ